MEIVVFCVRDVLGCLSFAKTLQGHKFRPVTMLQAHLHAFHFKRVLDYGEGQPMILLFLATADWRQPLRSVRPLTFPATALFLAFGTLYYLEHYR